MPEFNSKRLRKQYSSLRTFHQVLQFPLNRDGNRPNASRIGQILHMLHDRVEYPRSRISQRKLTAVANSHGVHIHPPHMALNLSLICPDWLSDNPRDLRSYNVKSLAEHQEETAWVNEFTDLVHQIRFVMTSIPHQSMRHAGMAALLNQHRADRYMVYFEPMPAIKTIPPVVKKWAKLEGVSTILLVHGNQKRGTEQCVRHMLEAVHRFSRSNQSQPTRGASFACINGRMQRLPGQQRPARLWPEMPRRYWDGVRPSSDEVDLARLSDPRVDLGVRVGDNVQEERRRRGRGG